jgi:proteasome lid subunit RPN8/RPN11
MDNSFELPEKLLSELTEALNDSHNKELCGFLLKNNTGELEFIRMANWADGLNEFFIAKSQYESIKLYSYRMKKELFAFLHSHISSLDMSSTDRDSFFLGDIDWIVIRLGPMGIEVKKYCRSHSL